MPSCRLILRSEPWKIFIYLETINNPPFLPKSNGLFIKLSEFENANEIVVPELLFIAEGENVPFKFGAVP